MYHGRRSLNKPDLRGEPLLNTAILSKFGALRLNCSYIAVRSTLFSQG